MSKKTDRAEHGPGWGEVILGAVLSAALGVVLGAVLLIIKPVVVVKEMPKEPVADAVYYIEGSRETAKAREAAAKRKAFAQGASVIVTEDEINALVAAVTTPAPATPAPAPAAKPGEAAPPPAASEMLARGAPNFRVRDGVMQIAVPVTVNVLDLGQKYMVQARGGLAKSGDGFVFQPDAFFVGSCPIQRLPFVPGFVRKKFLAAQAIPEDIEASWGKLANATIEGNVVKLTMP